MVRVIDGDACQEQHFVRSGSKLGFFFEPFHSLALLSSRGELHGNEYYYWAWIDSGVTSSTRRERLRCWFTFFPGISTASEINDIVNVLTSF